MDFFIKKNATLPTIKVKVVKDGRSDFVHLYQYLNDSDIFFSMVDVTTGIPKIVSAPCTTQLIENIQDNTTEYYFNFQFTQRETGQEGRYKGSFMIQNEQGDLVLPLTEDLYINIQDSIMETEFCC
jgi:hypothetical protein